jgi:hypothetical protein
VHRVLKCTKTELANMMCQPAGEGIGETMSHPPSAQNMRQSREDGGDL